MPDLILYICVIKKTLEIQNKIGGEEQVISAYI